MSEIPVSQEQMDLEAHWEMPKIGVGEQIHYLAQWNNSQKPTLAFVTRLSWRSIEVVFVADGRWSSAVDILHKDDPRLARNHNMQRNGSWEYSDLHKRVLSLEQRLAALETPQIHVMTDNSVIAYGTDAGNMGGMQQLSPAEVALGGVVVKTLAKKKREFTPEQKAAASQRLRDYHANKKLAREAALETANS